MEEISSGVTSVSGGLRGVLTWFVGTLLALMEAPGRPQHGAAAFILLTEARKSLPTLGRNTHTYTHMMSMDTHIHT